MDVNFTSEEVKKVILWNETRFKKEQAEPEASPCVTAVTFKVNMQLSQKHNED